MKSLAALSSPIEPNYMQNINNFSNKDKPMLDPKVSLDRTHQDQKLSQERIFYIPK